MIKKIIIALFATLIILFNFTALSAISFNSLKITDLVFDNSQNIIFLPTSNKTNEIENVTVESFKLENPQRTYYDIKNAILANPTSIDCYLKSSNINQIKLAQNNVNPNIVRLTIYHNDKINLSNVEVLKIQNGLIFKLNDPQIPKSFKYETYREEKKSNEDYYTPLGIFKTNSIQNLSKKNETVKDESKITKGALGNDVLNKILVPDNTLRLNSKYYINQILIKNGNVLVNGIGLVSYEKPFILNNPSRLIVDIPNARINSLFHNKVIKISETEKVHMSQFEPSKVRFVIYTENPNKYTPIIASDMQNMLIANSNRISKIRLYDSKAQLNSFKISKQSFTTDVMSFEFSLPTIYSIKRVGTFCEISFYNSYFTDIDKIKNAFKNSVLNLAKIEFFANSIIKISLPLPDSFTVSANETLDSKHLTIEIKHPLGSTIDKNIPPTVTLPTIRPSSSGKGRCPTKKLIVLDAGHGGRETGAIRVGLLEKDLTLDITKRLADILTKKGYKVEMTRWVDKDVSLQERVEFSNAKNPEVFMSIHINASVNESVRGVETHYYKDDSIDFAKIVQEKLSKINSPNRGVIKSKFYVINHTDAPAVLVEVGFMSNEMEREDMISEARKQKTAQMLAEAIIQYLQK